MQVSDILKKLSYEHLRNLSMSTAVPGEIRESDRPTIIGYINDGLNRIYSRFNLLERQLIINQYAHITNYHFSKLYALHNTDRPVDNYPYILDLPAEQFNDDFVRVLAVTDEYGERPLNDKDNPRSVYTPYPNVIQVPEPKENHPISVVYQATHPRLELSVTTAALQIPVVLEAPLLSIVASFVYRDMNTQDTTTKSQQHELQFETACKELEEKGNASISSYNAGHKFHERGFV